MALTGEEAESFAIEELTLNPFFSPENTSQEPGCDLWIEFVLRNDTETSLPIDRFPVVEFQLRDLRIPSVRPVEQFAENVRLPAIGINKLCYGEIWASFIPAADGRGDFMKTGYRRSGRRVGSNIDFKELVGHFTDTSLPQPQSSFRRSAEDLRNRLQLFEEVFCDTAKKGPGQATVPRGLGYGGTEIDVDDAIPAGALAFVRQPWGAPASNKSLGTIFACEAKIERSGLRWKIAPHPILAEAEAGAFTLWPQQRLAFWLLLRDVQCTRSDMLRTAFTFQLDVVSSAKIEHFNSFFRISPAYQFREGALTELRRYAAPPRLFSLWDSYSGSECYAHHSLSVAAETPHKINADFLFAKLDVKKLTSLFLLSLIINLLASFAINLVTALSIGGEATLPRRIRITEWGVDWSLTLILSQAVCVTASLGIVIYLMYNNKIRSWMTPSIVAIAAGVASGFVIHWFF